MPEHHHFSKLLLVVMPFVSLWSNSVALAADKDAAKQEGKAAGIYMEKKKDWLFVKVDGEEELVKYLIDPTDKKLADSFKTVLGISRVQLTYKTEGETKKLISIKRQILKATGTVTGVVVKNHGWWIEVKPKGGVSDAYACQFPTDKHKDIMDKLKDLKEGDSVTLAFTTDFERHRITTLRKNAANPSKLGGTF